MKIYEQRADILKEQGIISQTAYDKAMKVLSDMEQRYFLDDTTVMFMMHLIMCLERCIQDEQLQSEIPAIEWEEIDNFEACEQELKHIQQLACTSLNESEEAYLLLHLVNLHRRT